MSYATVRSCTLAGISALPVTVEIHIGGGLPGMSIVGLPQSAVRESKDRVKAAIMHTGFTYPMVKIVVNLAPADLPKQGGRFDLPIALGILVATGQLPAKSIEQLVVVGELGLTGTIRAVAGALPMSLAFSQSDNIVLLPESNGEEARLSKSTHLILANDLQQLVVDLKSGNNKVLADRPGLLKQGLAAAQPSQLHFGDMSEVRGQYQARRALEIAAAGGHNLLMVGPPGTGKSMLASRMPGIQPDMTTREAMETASIQSISHGGFDASNWAQRPFRSPHHTSSGVALVGGGSNPKPGEISLAHNGVLFLDELAEFPRAVLDVLREPMETQSISISRSNKQCEFPANFQLLAAMNPCPCGYLGDSQIQCRCTPEQIARYASRVSGPFLDRIDLTVPVTRLSRSDLQSNASLEASAAIRLRVDCARERQLSRQGQVNSRLAGKLLEQSAQLNDCTRKELNRAADKLVLSLRAMHRVQRVARTIADLAGEVEVRGCDVTEALSYRHRAS